MRKWWNDSFKAVAILAGTTIGAGIFSLPYVFSGIGWGTGAIYLVFFALVYFTAHLMFAEISVKSGAGHRFFYIAEKFLPPFFSKIASWTILGELIFSLTAYLALAPAFFRLIFAGTNDVYVFGGMDFGWVLVFWFFSSSFIFLSAYLKGGVETVGVLGIIFIVLAVFFASRDFSFPFDVFKLARISNFLMPFGPLLFSFAARPAISEILIIYKKSRDEGRHFSLKRVIFLGSAIPAVLYFVFIIAVLRFGPAVSTNALSSINVSPFLTAAFGVLGLLALWTSYFVLGGDARGIIHNDMKKSGVVAAGAVVFLPIAFYFFGFRNFLAVVSFVGGLFLALEGMFIVLMWQRAFPKHRHRFLAPPLYIVFAVSLVWTLWSLV